MSQFLKTEYLYVLWDHLIFNIKGAFHEMTLSKAFNAFATFKILKGGHYVSKGHEVVMCGLFLGQSVSNINKLLQKHLEDCIYS